MECRNTLVLNYLSPLVQSSPHEQSEGTRYEESVSATPMYDPV